MLEFLNLEKGPKTIPDGEMGSGTNPYIPQGGKKIREIVFNALAISGKWKNAPAFFTFQTRTYSITGKGDLNLEKGLGDEQGDKNALELVQIWVEEIQGWKRRKKGKKRPEESIN